MKSFHPRAARMPGWHVVWGLPDPILTCHRQHRLQYINLTFPNLLLRLQWHVTCGCWHPGFCVSHLKWLLYLALNSLVHPRYGANVTYLQVALDIQSDMCVAVSIRGWHVKHASTSQNDMSHVVENIPVRRTVIIGSSHQSAWREAVFGKSTFLSVFTFCQNSPGVAVWLALGQLWSATPTSIPGNQGQLANATNQHPSSVDWGWWCG